MEPKTLEALNASIAKWERNAVAETPEAALVLGDSCPLCHLFCPDDRESDGCDGCPVKERSGYDQCSGTPWFAAYSAHRTWEQQGSSGAWRDDFHAKARAEVAFLKSLLPTSPTSLRSSIPCNEKIARRA